MVVQEVNKFYKFSNMTFSKWFIMNVIYSLNKKDLLPETTSNNK